MIVKQRVILWLMMALLIGLYPFSAVFAHSPLIKVSPQGGQELETPPSVIELWFKDAVELYQESIIVKHETGVEVQKGKAVVDPKDPRHVSLFLKEDVPSGSYQVLIEVLGIDGHPIRENYQFEVAEPKLTGEERLEQLKLDQAIPGDGTLVKTSPKQMELWFTQPAQLEVFGLFNDKGGVILTDDPKVDPEDPKHYTVAVNDDLPKGTYTASWYASIGNRSKNGLFYFAVEEVTSYAPEGGVSTTHFFEGIGMGQLANWLLFISLLLLFGGEWFRSVITKENGDSLRWSKVSLWLYGMGLAGFFILFSNLWMKLSEVSLREFLSSRSIWIPLIQFILWTIGYTIAKGRWKLFFFGLSLFMLALSGHSVSPLYGGGRGIAVDAIHLFAVSIWMGGLVALWVMKPKEGRVEWLRETGRVYSKWALGSVLAMILTGIWMMFTYIPTFSFESFMESRWGKMISMKVVLLTGIIAMAYFQRNSLKQWSPEMLNPFFQRIRIELLFGSFILVAAAILVDLSPSAAEQGVYPNKMTRGGITAHVKITPFEIGANDILVQFENQSELKEVYTQLSMAPIWKIERRAFSIGEGQYRLTGNLLHGAGTIFMDVIAVKKDGEKVRFPFRLEVPGEMSD
ncbi:copper resistance protein CopC [Ammoniphilus sp. 3BR4]